MSSSNKLRFKFVGKDDYAEIGIRPVGLMAAERKWGKEQPDIEGTMYAAWVSVGMPGGKDGGFDDWVASIEDMQPPEEAPADPSVPTQATSAEPSPDSQ